ncbi:hypothetical protein PENTCL1PPCAC_30010, partial [Pristionchus entomophagus]
ERKFVEDKLRYLDSCSYSIVLPSIDTSSIIGSIRRWGDKIETKFSDKKDPSEMLLDPTPSLPVLSINLGAPVEGIKMKGKLDASVVPLRIHAALDLFTELHERRFGTISSNVDAPKAVKRLLSFQLGLKFPPQATFTPQEVIDRYAYEKDVMARSAVAITGPKIIGGYRRIFNLRDTEMTTKEVIDTYSRTPTVPPLWSQAKATPLYQSSRVCEEAKISPPQPSSGPKVLRKSNVVLIRRAPSAASHSNQQISNDAGSSRQPESSEIKVEDQEDDGFALNEVNLRNPVLPPSHMKEEFEDGAILTQPSTTVRKKHVSPTLISRQPCGTGYLSDRTIVSNGRFIENKRYEFDADEMLYSQQSTSTNMYRPTIDPQPNGPGQLLKRTYASKLRLSQHKHNGTRLPGSLAMSAEKARETSTNMKSYTQWDSNCDVRQQSARTFPVLWEPPPKKPQEWPPRKPEDLVRRIDTPVRPHSQSTIDTNDPTPQQGGSCFVCTLFRKQNGYPRTWQCEDCERMGRAITPIEDSEELAEQLPPPKKRGRRSTQRKDVEVKEEVQDEEEEVSTRRSGRQRKVPSKYT